MYGPQAAQIAEGFTPRLRYTGACYHLSSVVSGGPAPLIATALLAAFGSSYVIALYILGCASASSQWRCCRTVPVATFPGISISRIDCTRRPLPDVPIETQKPSQGRLCGV
jgi:hypothetical protein